MEREVRELDRYSGNFLASSMCNRECNVVDYVFDEPDVSAEVT